MRSKKGENMGEIKSVKVDNWGVFFLQKLQNFFNKTDYCDLTLQFNDNSQLKVHRLVLNACTDYFNVLEQTCEMIDDVLIMPNELQADLVVPIVNFMYTGTLEFELKIYGKLLKTARDMNMTVLLKLLEAHRRTMETKPKNQKPSPKSAGYTPNKSSLSSNKSLLQKTSNRSVISNSESIYKTVQIKPFGSSNYKSGTALTKSQTKTVPVKGPTRFEYEGSETLGSFDPTFDNISYESKPLKVEYEEQSSQSETSPFEQLRQTGYNNNKRPAQSILESPPAKKPNIQDVKEYAEQQRMRKQIAEEYGEEPDFESILDDEFHNNDDDEEYSTFQENTRPTTSKQSVSQHTSPKKQTSSLRKSNDSSNQHKPTIVVKECSSTNVDHAKIISEVLRKYPHLIKNNKNIKLKIMPTTGGSGTQKVVIKHESEEQHLIAPAIKQEPISPRKVSQTVSTTVVKSEKLASPTGKVLQGVVQKSSVVSASPTPNQPRRIDSKTMKQLIALGAENTTGPWLCLRCGVNGRPISIPSYRGFRRHLVNTHKEKIDPRLCEHCGWRSINQKELAFHMYTQHDVRTSISFPKCEHCGTVVYDLQALDQHIDDVHPEVKEDNQQCIYCNKTFSTELMLYNHMKDQHKDRARDDGVIDFSEEDEAYEEYEQKIQGITETNSGSKIQILSNIDLPKCISLTQINKSESNTEFDTENLVEILGGNSQIMQPTDLITSIPPTISNEPKFINADGNVMELTAAQRAEIMSQLEQGGDGVVMVLDETFGERETSKTEENANEEVSPETTEQEPDQHMVMNSLTDEVDDHVEEQVMEEETVQESQEEKKNEHHDIGEDLEEQLNAWKPIQTKEKSKDNDSLKDKDELEETTDTLDEQLEKLTQMAHPMVELKKVEKPSKDELDERLKILTNDWTDDDEEEGEEENLITDKIKNVTDVENKNEEDPEGETKTSIEVKSKLDNKIDNENIEDILKDNLDNEKQLEMGEIIDEQKDQVDNKPEDKSISEGLLQKDIDNTEDSLVQQDSGDSDDEEQVLREQPICATEEDTPPTDNNLLNSEVSSSEPATLQQNEETEKEETSIKENEKAIEANDLNIKDEVQDLDKGSKSLNNSTDNEINENKDIEIENRETSACETSDVPVEEKNIRKLSTDSKQSKIETDKKPTTDMEKEEIKSIINEWDEENDDDNEDL